MQNNKFFSLLKKMFARYNCIDVIFFFFLPVTGLILRKHDHRWSATLGAVNWQNDVACRPCERHYTGDECWFSSSALERALWGESSREASLDVRGDLTGLRKSLPGYVVNPREHVDCFTTRFEAYCCEKGKEQCTARRYRSGTIREIQFRVESNAGLCSVSSRSNK